MRLALLVCGALSPPLLAVHGDYGAIYTRYFSNAYSPDAFTLDSYDVTASKYPADGDLDNYSALVLTGSASSAHKDIEWINYLTSYIARVAATKPSIKIIGICFGHQIVARAMGGEVVRNNGTWEVGPTQIALTDMGKAIFGVDSFYIQQMHQDHVPSVPTNFHLLGSTPVSVNQGMVRFYKDKEPPSTNDINFDDIHILTLQGHPEYTEPIVSGVVKQRSAEGIINKVTAEDALGRRRFWPNDGVGIIGHAIWNTLGVKIPRPE
ncbi:hypothetical protein AX15_002390 [Amanita polypyramis BW_CC]|nr:hypothetical protein AX15_002390 [Amanita polypyramis BW_CC]